MCCAGLDDFALIDKISKKCLYQIKLTGRPEELDMYSDEPLLASSAEDYAHASLEMSAGKAQAEGTIGVRRGSIGTTVEVLTYDAQDAALNPASGLGPDSDPRSALERIRSENSLLSSDSGSSSGKDVGDLRAAFARAHSDSNNDVIQMFRTETDEMLQSKIEAALEEERAATAATALAEVIASRDNHDVGDDRRYPAHDKARRHDNEKERDTAKDRDRMIKPVEDKNTQYITVMGRRNEDAEYVVLLKIPLHNGKPFVTMPSAKAPVPGTAEAGKVTAPFTPNSRDIAIATPTTKPPQDPKRNPLSPPAGRGHQRNPSYYADKDMQVSAALRAMQNGTAMVDYASDTELEVRQHVRHHSDTSGRDPANRHSLNTADTSPRPPHQRNRTFDFAQISGSFYEVAPAGTPTPKGDQDAERRFSGNASRLRNASTDSICSETPSTYVLNPHTSNRDISFFAIPTGNTPHGTPTATPKRMSRGNSNNNSGSNLSGLYASALTDSGTNLASYHPHGADHGHVGHTSGIAVSHHDVIQIPRHSRSNSFLSDYGPGIATHRSSFSSEVSDSNHTAPPSQLHQQLQQAGVVYGSGNGAGNGGSRSSSRPGSVNFFTSANLGGGGFSSDDCSDGESSASESESEMSSAPYSSVVSRCLTASSVLNAVEIIKQCNVYAHALTSLFVYLVTYRMVVRNTIATAGSGAVRSSRRSSLLTTTAGVPAARTAAAARRIRRTAPCTGAATAAAAPSATATI
jgi:hypothetical protein